MENIVNLLQLGQPGDWTRMLRIGLNTLIIAMVAWLMVRVSRRVIQALHAFMSARHVGTEPGKRFETLSRVFRYLSTSLIILIAGMLILSEVGISIAPILGAAGVVGIAVGFGAQSLIKDYFTGVFLLIEDQLRVGDVVEAGNKSGLVEEITLRYLRLRDFEGNVHFVPNGLISTVTNRSREFAFAVIEVGVAYREDVEDAFSVMRDIGAQMRESADFGPKIISEIEIIGVESLEASAVILRCRLKVNPLEQWNVRREFLKRLKRGLQEKDIEIPYPHLTVYAGQDKEGLAPPLRVLSTRAPTEN